MKLTIGKLAGAGDVGVETIRYYQRRGLIDTPTRPGGEGWGAGVRYYGDEDVRRLHFIRSAQAAGFTLAEIARLVELDATDDRTEVRIMTEARIVALDDKIAELTQARASLAKLAKQCGDGDKGPCPILEAFVSGLE